MGGGVLAFLLFLVCSGLHDNGNSYHHHYHHIIVVCIHSIFVESPILF